MFGTDYSSETFFFLFAEASERGKEKLLWESQKSFSGETRLPTVK